MGSLDAATQCVRLFQVPGRDARRAIRRSGDRQRRGMLHGRAITAPFLSGEQLRLGAVRLTDW